MVPNCLTVPANGGTQGGKLGAVKIKDFGRSSANVELSSAELSLVNNALNEVSNGVGELSDEHEFVTRLGTSRDDAGALLAALGDLIRRANALPG
jgi:hypothetical protein